MREQPLRMLVVDDEPQIRRFLRTSLSAHSYQVTEAADGQEALTRAMTERPDVVVLDLGVPRPGRAGGPPPPPGLVHGADHRDLRAWAGRG